MTKVFPLMKSGVASVWRFHHPLECRHVDEPPDSAAETFSINYVEHGSFGIVSGGLKTSFCAGDIFIVNPGDQTRFTHSQDYPDDVCTCIDYEPEIIEDAFGFRNLTSSKQIPKTPLTGFLRRQMQRAVESLDPMARETYVFNAALGLFGEPSSRPSSTAFNRNFTWYLRRIERACDLMSASYAASLSLRHVANEAGMSPFVFARRFKQVTGQSPHRYLVRVRLAQASKSLRAGATVTDAALVNGFNNLSHFIRCYSRAFGTPPGRYAKQFQKEQRPTTNSVLFF